MMVTSVTCDCYQQSGHFRNRFVKRLVSCRLVKHAIFAVLVVIPLALIAWIVREGRHVPPTSSLPSASASAAAPVDPEDQSLLALFQGDPGGVKTKAKVALYDSKGLFDYIDGAAPLYIERKFRKLAAAEMVTAEGSELVCDVYDMRAPENATSIFQKEKSSASKPVADWPQAISGPMSFIFLKGRYYVKLTAFDKTAEAALPALARALRERMQ
jgi:hypothetical protein